MKDKEVVFEIDDTYTITGSSDDDYGVFVGLVKWYGKESRGIDIRNYDKNKDKLYKGLTVPYDSIDEILDALIARGYGNKNDLLTLLNERETVDMVISKPVEEMPEPVVEVKKPIFTMEDFDHMFKNVNREKQYIRDDYGNLRDNNGCYVIMPRHKTS